MVGDGSGGLARDVLLAAVAFLLLVGSDPFGDHLEGIVFAMDLTLLLSK